MLERDGAAVVAEVLPPALRDAGLDRDAGARPTAAAPTRGRRRPAPRTTRGTASTRRGSGCPSASSASRAASASCTSEPVAIRMHRRGAAGRRRPGRSRRGPRPRPRRERPVRSSVGRFWRVRTRPVGPAAAQDLAPGHGGLVGVGRAHDVEAGDRAQRPEVLDRLVGRAVLAEADRVVRPHEGDAALHERGEPHRGAHVVAEHQEGAAEGAQQAVTGRCRSGSRPWRARGCRSAGSGRTGLRAAERRVGLHTVPAGRNDGAPSIVVLLLSARSAEPPHSSGSCGGERVEDLAGGRAGGDGLAGREHRQRRSPRAACARASRSSSAARSGLRRAPRGERRRPTRRAARRRGPPTCAGVGEDVVGDRRRSAPGRSRAAPWWRRPRRRRAPSRGPCRCSAGAAPASR